MIKGKSLGDKHDKKKQKQADKRINKDEKERFSALRNTETVNFWKEAGGRYVGHFCIIHFIHLLNKDNPTY